jgi:hypothetical protein
MFIMMPMRESNNSCFEYGRNFQPKLDVAELRGPGHCVTGINTRGAALQTCHVTPDFAC